MDNDLAGLLACWLDEHLPIRLRRTVVFFSSAASRKS